MSSDEVTSVECECGAFVPATEPKCPNCGREIVKPRRTEQIRIADTYATEGLNLVAKLEHNGSDLAHHLARQGREHVERFQTWQTMMPTPPERSQQTSDFSTWYRNAFEFLTTRRPPP